MKIFFLQYVLFIFIITCLNIGHAKIVYMTENQSQKNIYSLDEASKQINQLTFKLNTMQIYPSISSNGKFLAFVEGETPTKTHLVILNLATNATLIYEHPFEGLLIHPKWTRNGKSIFFSAPNQNNINEVFYFDLDYSLFSPHQTVKINPSIKTFSSNNDPAFFPFPSSDGLFLTYQKNSNGKKGIYIYSFIKKLETFISEGMSPSFSFDEKTITFTKKVNGYFQIFFYNRFTGTISQETFDDFQHMAPALTKEGDLLYAKLINGRYEIFRNHQPFIQMNQMDLYSPQASGDEELIQKQLPNIPGVGRSSFGVAKLNEFIYLCGGHVGPEHTYPEESFSQDCFRFNIVSKNWENLPPRPSKAHGYQMIADGKYIYAFGGFAFSAQHRPKWKSLDAIERFNTETFQWENVGQLILPRSSNIATIIGRKVYLVGGWNSTPKFPQDYDGIFHSEIEVFDLDHLTSSINKYSMPLPLRRAFSGFTLNNKIILAGGIGEGAKQFKLLDQVTLFDPLTGQIEELAKLPYPTFAPAIYQIKNNLFLFGGMYETQKDEYEYVSHIYQLDLNHSISNWNHTGRFLQETKGFSQILPISNNEIGILGGHHYDISNDSPVSTFEIFIKN